MKKNLIGLSKEEIGEILYSLGVEKKHLRMRVSQIFHSIYYRGVRNLNEITTISKNLRLGLDKKFNLERPSIVKSLSSIDGTQKWLISLQDKKEIETVFIPEKKRGSLCVSSQVGCTLNCSFCHTGTMKLVRNLNASEILQQVMISKDDLNDWLAADGERRLTNIIFMGMGEPLYNYLEVSKTIKILTDPEGINFSKRKITLSTAGIVPSIKKVGKELGVGLAISLHAVNDEVRDKLVPINKKYPIRELIDSIKEYSDHVSSRKVTFEYVMLRGVNDSNADARELCRLISGIPAKINLIPFNPWPSSLYECSDDKRIREFSQIIHNSGYYSPVRTPRGRDIMAACGQLISDSKKDRKSQPTGINL